MWTNYHATLHQVLKDRSILAKNSRVLVAVSGGQDSLCLARLILDLQSKWNWQVAIAHCHHNWALDEGLPEHLEQICRDWGVKLYLETATESIPEKEASARKWRYQVLSKIAVNHSFNSVVTGHTKSDRTETFLYNLIRGAGSEGLSSLNWYRPLTHQVQLVRPLLNFTRQDTLRFCQINHLPIWYDPYNNNKKFSRNRIRLDLIPYLQQEFNSQVENHLAQTAEILRADSAYLNQQAEELYFKIALKPNTIDRQKLKDSPLSLQRRVIKKFLGQNLTKMPNFEQIEQIVALIDAPSKTKSSSLGRSRIDKESLVVAQVHGNVIIIT